MLTYAYVCLRIQTYADVCVLLYSRFVSIKQLIKYIDQLVFDTLKSRVRKKKKLIRYSHVAHALLRH